MSVYKDEEFEKQLDREKNIREHAKRLINLGYTTKQAYELAKKHESGKGLESQLNLDLS